MRVCRTMLATLVGPGVLGGPVAAAQSPAPPPGFKALFNGKDLTGWQGLVEFPQRAKLTKEALVVARQKEADDKYLPHWTVVDNAVLHDDGNGQSLQTLKITGATRRFLEKVFATTSAADWRDR